MNQDKMSPKEKAIQLYNKFYGIPLYIKNVKEACVIAVDEILDTLNFDIGNFDVNGSVLIDLIHYWKQVKEEINKL
jgi:hypothetical protein